MILSGTVLLILSIISPMIISYLTKSTMSSQAKQVVALLVSLVIAVIVAFTTGGTSLLFTSVNGFFESLAVAAPTVYTIQQAVYSFIFKDTEFNRHLQEDVGVGKNEGITDESDADGSGFLAEEIDESIYN